MNIACLDRVADSEQGLRAILLGGSIFTRDLTFDDVLVTINQVDVTPDLDAPGTRAKDRVSSVTGDVDKAFFRMAFWPSLGGGQDYKFPMVGIDSTGRKIPSSSIVTSPWHFLCDRDRGT